LKKKLRKEYEQSIQDFKASKTEDIKSKMNSNNISEENNKKNSLDLKLWMKLQCQAQKSESEYSVEVLKHQFTNSFFF